MAVSLGRRATTSLLLFFCLLSGCTTSGPAWRSKASSLVDDVTGQQAAVLFPHEFQGLLEAFEHGEAVLHVQQDGREADTLYLIAIQKGIGIWL